MLSLLILVSITFTLTAPKPITPQPINKSTSPPSHAQKNIPIFHFRSDDFRFAGEPFQEELEADCQIHYDHQ